MQEKLKQEKLQSMMFQRDGEQRLKNSLKINEMTISELIELLNEVTQEIESRAMELVTD